MNILAFPGQGSQKIGMGKIFYENFDAAKSVFQEVDDTLNFNLSKLIFDGDMVWNFPWRGRKATLHFPILPVHISEDGWPKFVLIFNHLTLLISGILYSPLPPIKAISIFVIN